ncbi:MULTISPECIES: hypothetical protein [unclassified Actinomadura]|uniref:hypothetical protein n=1 Tax=unclassified Actinomadura TaxID=2626254 RepID=UPI0011EEF448|nr:hypothetical protein [Actinomadura sp. K4S16]
MSATLKKTIVLGSSLALAAAGALSPIDSASAAAPETTVAAPATASAAKGRCGGNLPATPKRWTYSKGSCGLIGYPGAWHSFRWTATHKYAALQVKTYNTRGQAYWVKCGSGGGVCQVPIGNNAFTPQFRAWNAVAFSHIYITY